jgi:uncharacterized protein YndB with AHSA1/START domain
MQLRLNTPTERVWAALTDPHALQRWFCEFADSAPNEGRYDFWGRYTPEAPDREAGCHPVTRADLSSRLSFDWRLKSAETGATFSLLARDGGQSVLTLRQVAQPRTEATQTYWLEDFWFLSLENLRRYLDGKACDARVDFTNPMKGDTHHHLDIDAPASRVFAVLTDPAEVNRWFATNASIDLQVGGTYDLGWGEGTATKIIDLIPDKRLSLQSRQGYSPETMRDTVMTWTLEESGGKTRLTFVHSGFSADDDVSGTYTGWLSYLGKVRSIAEYGAGWQPPIPVIAPDAVAYSATVHAAQAEIVDELRQG